MATEKKPGSVALQVFAGLFLFFAVLPVATCAMCGGGGLLAITGGTSSTAQGNACREAWRQAQPVGDAVRVFQQDHDGACPASVGELFVEKYLARAPIDPWGRPFKASCPPKGGTEPISAWSLGPDGIEGTTDDVRGWLPIERACQ